MKSLSLQCVRTSKASQLMVSFTISLLSFSYYVGWIILANKYRNRALAITLIDLYIHVELEVWWKQEQVLMSRYWTVIRHFKRFLIFPIISKILTVLSTLHSYLILHLTSRCYYIMIKSFSAQIGKWGCYVGCLVYWAWLYKVCCDSKTFTSFNIDSGSWENCRLWMKGTSKEHMCSCVRLDM